MVAKYSSKKHGWGALDGKIIQAGGRKYNAGTGTMLATGVRDLDFWFPVRVEKALTPAQQKKYKAMATKCKAKIKRIKGVSVSMRTLYDEGRMRVARKQRARRARRTTR